METKPGPKTTEFWVMVYVQLMQLANLTGVWNFVPNRVSGYIVAAVTFAYAIARGIAKANVKPDIPPNPPANRL